MICVAIKGPSIAEARQQINQALKCADLVELRLDCFDEWDMSTIQNLRSDFSLPMIFTLRCKEQGGSYQQSEEKRLATLCSLADLKPEYLDIESHVPAQIVADIRQKHPGIHIIVSYHNFLETPKNLEDIHQEMRKIPAHFYKIAVTAQDSLDAMRLCCWAKQTDGHVIAISMGAHGQFSRILAPIIRSPITYCSLDENLKSAPGQMSPHILLGRYHYRSLNPHTAIYGLIGDPVDMSISDQTHNGWIRANHIDAVYVKVNVKIEQLSDFLQLAKQLPFKGLSVTMPLKENIIPHLDHIDEEAHAIGAVNTLLFKNDHISGFNTDGKGALNAIEQECSVKDQHIVILGAGGAAKAIIYEARHRGAHVTILNRDKEKAHHLASRFHCDSEGLDHLRKCCEKGYDILINSIPLSMPPIDDQDILPHAIVMDIKTKPKETSLLKNAKQKGCKVIYGYRMFIEQAIGQYSLWFGDSFQRQEARLILEQEAEKALV